MPVLPRDGQILTVRWIKSFYLSEMCVSRFEQGSVITFNHLSGRRTRFSCEQENMQSINQSQRARGDSDQPIELMNQLSAAYTCVSEIFLSAISQETANSPNDSSCQC